MRQYQKIESRQENKKQAGVTLLLAILILSSILAISFSLATILFIEVRTSADLLRTEASIYGAQAVSEEVMFNIQQQTGSFQYVSKINNNKVSLTSTSTSLADTVLQDVVKTSSYTFYNTANVYALYDVSATDPTTAGSGYGKIKVTYLSTGNTDDLQVYLCEFDPTGTLLPSDKTPACSDPASSNSYYRANDTLRISGISTIEYSISNNKMHSNRQQVLVLYNSTTPYPTKDIYVQIEAFAADEVTPKGIPNFNYTTIDITANNNGVIRRLRTTVPNPNNSGKTNVALAANGATAVASTEHISGKYPASNTIIGNRSGAGWGQGTGGWNDDTSNAYPDWLEVDFAGSKTITEIDVFTTQNDPQNPVNPTSTTPSDMWGIVDFSVQYWNGSAWTIMPGGSVTGNTLAWRQFTFPAVTTSKIRVFVTKDAAMAPVYSRIVNIEAY
jgi:hypothetical protein